MVWGPVHEIVIGVADRVKNNEIVVAALNIWPGYPPVGVTCVCVYVYVCMYMCVCVMCVCVCVCLFRYNVHNKYRTHTPTHTHISICAVDFVLGPKGESPLKMYDQWRSWADPKVCCDYSFHVCITWWNKQVHDEMDTLVREKGGGLPL